jgi:hypothetical protein
MPLEHQIVYQKNSIKTHDLRSWPCVTGKQKAELEEDRDGPKQVHAVDEG